MSEANLNNSTEHEPEDLAPNNEPIVPIDFSPANVDQPGWRFKPNPAQIGIAGILLCCAGAAWFVLSAKSVFIDVSPLNSIVSVHSPFAIKVGPRYLIRKGDIAVSVSAEGYYELDTSLTVGEAQAQTFLVDLIRLPGLLNLTTAGTNNASVIIDGELIGTSPLTGIELAAGEHSMTIEKDRYQSVTTVIDIEGRTIAQDINIELLPAWASISFNSSPVGATVSVDGVEVGQTPLSTDVLEGEHQLLIKLNAHKALSQTLSVAARVDQTLPQFELIEADGLVFLQSTPINASVTLDGVYQGQTPLELSITPGSAHQLAFFSNGYEDLQREIQSSPDEEISLNVTLEPIVSSVQISAQPSDAQLYINGEFIGNANQTIELLAASQLLEVRREGYVSFETRFISRPGLEQNLNISLISLEQERINAIKPQITNASGQTLKLLYPGSFRMGASRREAGRQANESFRNIALNSPFYLSLTEVTNAEFANFDAEHSSGVLEGRTLDNSSQPVVRVSWSAAARYCNWLSRQEGLTEFYIVENQQVSGANFDSDGYRLPTEAEWAWAARVNGDASSLLKFPWGAQLPPPLNHGNYADISAASFLPNLISNYNDSFAGSAPVASFEPNSNGFFDMGGNVAEWSHDYYGSSGQLSGVETVDPFGPETGRYHVVRGSSWAHGSVTQLRLSYRDYSEEARDDLGFRVARTLKP